MNRASSQDRIRSAIGVALLHALLGYGLIAALGFDPVSAVGARLKVFDVAVEPPPPPVEEIVQPKTRTGDPEGAAAPPNLKARPAPVVAPPPEVRLDVPPPVVAAPVPGPGPDPSAGASDRAGPGTGAGGEGSGFGSGGRGTGTGGGGGARGARLVSGRIVDRDYPRSAWRGRIEGSVIVRLAVGADGRVGRCTVTRSSGDAELDSTTCSLIEQRFRYEPARDSEGRPVPAVMGWRQDWWLD